MIIVRMIQVDVLLTAKSYKNLTNIHQTHLTMEDTGKRHWFQESEPRFAET